jgi:two-component system response regulator DevR
MTAATPSTLRVLVADDHRLMLAAVRRALSRAEGVEVVGEVDEATKIVPTVGRLLPDVVLLDIRMPRLDGLTCLERLRRLHPDVAVVILSTFAGDDYVEAARERGASGYIVKTVDPLQLADMVRTAVASPEFVVFRPEVADPTPAAGEEHGLSERELTIVRALAQGLTNKQIGSELCVSEQTVKFHLRNIYRKLAIGSRVEAARWAIANGLARTSATSTRT